MMKIETLLLANLEWLKAKARYLCRNTMDAEDLASDTILKLLEYEKHFDGQRGFRPWAQTIMHNIWVTRCNRVMCIPFVPLQDYDAAIRAKAGSDYDIAVIQDTIELLAKKYDSVKAVKLYIEGMSVAEIAIMMHIPVATVRSRMFFGRKRIKDTMVNLGINVRQC